MVDRSVVVRLRAEVQGFRQAMNEASESARRTAKDTREAGVTADTSLGQMVQSADKHKDAWNSAGSTLLGFGAAAVAGVGLAIRSYAEFDKQMSSVQAATHATGGEMESFRELAVKAGADTSFSAKEAGQGIEELAKAGVGASDILKGGLAGSLSLAAAGSLAVADAAELAATAMTQFNLKGEKIPHLADLLSAGAGKAQGSVEDIGNALKQSGLVASQFGISIEETVGGLAAFASAGLLGSDAGTSLKSALLKLAAPSKEAAGTMAELGIAAYDSKGEFVGLEDLAGQLQGSMSKLTQAQRDQSLATIFGTDAIRVANVLYKEGAAGIAEWTDKVNESGYAANTAAIMQDNLAGDIEKLGGSLDSVFLKSASGANDVLRGLVGSTEDLVDAVGNIPGPILQAVLGFTAVTGASALLLGGFLKVFPAAMETRAAFQTLAKDSPRLAGGLGKVAKGAGIAAAALVALQIAAAVFTEKNTKSAEEYGQALLKVAENSKGIDGSGLNSVFEGFDRFAGGDIVTNVEGMAGAVERISNQTFDDSGNKFFQGFTDFLGLPKGEIGQLEDRFRGLGDAMGNLVRNGGAETAAKSFAALSAQFEKNGKTSQDALDAMPGYKAALLDQANAAGVTLDKYQLMDLALGVIPPALQAAAGATETYTDATGKSVPVTDEMKEKLADVGLAADGAVVSLSKLLDAMYASGLIAQSARDAEAAYQEQLDGLKESIDKVKASQSEGNLILDAATGSFDLTTAAGRSANGVFGDLQASAIATTKAMAENGATQPELQDKLGKTYQSLVDAATAFGMGEDKAKDLAREALGIPKNVEINTAIANYADTMAKAQGIKDAVDRIPTFKQMSINVQYTESGTAVRDRASDAGMSNMVNAHEDGGIVGYENGGIVAAANGLRRESMIAKGGANILWAEPSTGWEAYISGKPGMEQRNAGILKTIAPRFGLEVTQRSRSFSGSSAPAMGGGGGGGTADFNGNLYLDSGEFLGKVHGVAVQAATGVMHQADKRSALSRTGRK